MFTLVSGGKIGENVDVQFFKGINSPRKDFCIFAVLANERGKNKGI
jgi:hypothetical protein